MNAQTHYLVDDQTGDIKTSDSAIAVDYWFQTKRQAHDDYNAQKERAHKLLLATISRHNQFLKSEDMSLTYFFDLEQSSDGATWPELSIQCLKMKQGKYYFYADIQKKCLILPFGTELERVDPDNYPSNEIIKDFPLDKGIDCPNIGRA